METLCRCHETRPIARIRQSGQTIYPLAENIPPYDAEADDDKFRT